MGKTYHKFTLAQTAQFATPTLDLRAVLKAAAPNVTEVIVRSLDSLAPALPDAVEAERFAFYDKVLSGTPEREPRWSTACCATRSPKSMSSAISRPNTKR